MVLKIVFWVVCGVIALVSIYSIIRKKQFVSLFKHGNVIVSGLRGCGKDFAFCLVVNARKQNYISNIQYSNPKKKYKRFDFDPKVWELADNDYVNFITGEIHPYVYPYPDDIDYYISDAGIYFPAQYQGELCKKYRSAPVFQALSRHLGDCNVHCNTQNMPRLWDKIREQSDIYLRMTCCKKLFKKFFYVSSYLYEKQESCENKVVPPKFGIGKTAKAARYDFEIQHGKIRKFAFFCRLPYVYDSRRFKKILENNCKDYENEN